MRLYISLSRIEEFIYSQTKATSYTHLTVTFEIYIEKRKKLKGEERKTEGKKSDEKKDPYLTIENNSKQIAINKRIYVMDKNIF